jgi:hypothetical protein
MDVTKAGFKDEAQLWTWLKSRLRGKWERCEAIFPEGFPDAFGTNGGVLHFLERKVGRPEDDVYKMMEPGQKEFFKWIASCTDTPLWIVVGYTKARNVAFYRWPDLKTKVMPPWYNGKCDLSSIDERD